MDELLENFFNCYLENEITEAMFDRDYVFPISQMEDYILSLLVTPYSSFINYISTHFCAKPIQTADIPIISDYEMSTRGVCEIMRKMGDPGLNYLQLGLNMFDDGIERKPEAYNKYGETHVKGASIHGLTHCCGRKWFLTCLGYIFPDLDEEMSSALSSRTLLRNPFFHNVISVALERDVNIRDYMIGLSVKSLNRRKSSCMHFVNTITTQCEQEKIPLHSIFFSLE